MCAGLRCLQPALQYIAGELPVEEGLVLPVMASHNTVRLRFDVESADYLNLHKPDASFPHAHFSMLADEERCQVGVPGGGGGDAWLGGAHPFHTSWGASSGIRPIVQRFQQRPFLTQRLLVPMPRRPTSVPSGAS